jgi:hypothetical protein
MPRVTPIAIGIIAAVMLHPTGASAATTQIGSAPPVGTPLTCIPDSAHVQGRTADDVTYVVPFDGVIKRWKHQGGTGTGKLALGVYTPTNVNLSYIPRAESKVEKAKAGKLNRFKTRIPVKAGEVIGLRVVSGAVDCRTATNSSEDQDNSMTPAPPVSDMPTSYGLAQTNLRLNVSAVIRKK